MTARRSRRDPPPPRTCGRSMGFTAARTPSRTNSSAAMRARRAAFPVPLKQWMTARRAIFLTQARAAPRGALLRFAETRLWRAGGGRRPPRAGVGGPRNRVQPRTRTAAQPRSSNKIASRSARPHPPPHAARDVPSRPHAAWRCRIGAPRSSGKSVPVPAISRTSSRTTSNDATGPASPSAGRPRACSPRSRAAKEDQGPPPGSSLRRRNARSSVDDLAVVKRQHEDASLRHLGVSHRVDPMRASASPVSGGYAAQPSLLQNLSAAAR